MTKPQLPDPFAPIGGDGIYTLGGVENKINALITYLKDLEYRSMKHNAETLSPEMKEKTEEIFSQSIADELDKEYTHATNCQCILCNKHPHRQYDWI